MKCYMKSFKVDFLFSGDIMDDDGFEHFPVIDNDSCVVSCDDERNVSYMVKLYLRDTLL